MNTKTVNIESALTFQTPLNLAITIQPPIALNLNIDNIQLVGCHLEVTVPWSQYEQIEQSKLFNLKPEFKGKMQGTDLSLDLPVTMTVSLSPDLFPNLLANIQTNDIEAKSIGNYLLQLSQKKTDSPLLKTESWYLLKIQQNHGQVSYRTLWDYIDLGNINHPSKVSQALLDGIADFYKQSRIVKELMADDELPIDEEMLEKITQLGESLIKMSANDHISNQTIVDTLSKSITNLLKASIENAAKSTQQINPSNLPTSKSLSKHESMVNVVMAFFLDEDWEVEHNTDETMFRAYFEGTTAKWPCYVKILEQTKQLVFYSVPEIKVPKSKRTQVAEFITRANYGLISGNFELDFEDGEVRFKTSLDIKNSSLDIYMVENLAYANIWAIERYLPGMINVIESKVSPQKAIAKIESSIDV